MRRHDDLVVGDRSPKVQLALGVQGHSTFVGVDLDYVIKTFDEHQLVVGLSISHTELAAFI